MQDKFLMNIYKFKFLYIYDMKQYIIELYWKLQSNCILEYCCDIKYYFAVITLVIYSQPGNYRIQGVSLTF